MTCNEITGSDNVAELEFSTSLCFQTKKQVGSIVSQTSLYININ